MTSTAPEAETLRELEADTRQAWSTTAIGCAS